MPASPSQPARLFLSISCVDRLLQKGDSPLTCPGVHPEAAESLLRQADDFSHQQGYHIDLEVPAEDEHRLDEVRIGLQNWSHDRATLVTQDLRQRYRRGTKGLLLALLVVAALVIVVEWLEAFGQGRLYRLFGESLVIIAWVTLWLPVETLLMEPIALRRQRQIFQALSQASVRFTLRQGHF